MAARTTLNLPLRLWAVALLAAALALTVVHSLGKTGGLLVYSLDDPYIHLALAEMITRGSYGVNVGEFASPSSSIVYPFLVAGLLALGLDVWGPLLLNTAAALACAWLIAGLLEDYGVAPRPGPRVVAAVVLIPLLLVALNLVALPMTGMEHTLHVLASLAVVVGMVRLRPGAPVPALLILGILLAPLIRFEGLALSGAALFALLLTRHVRASLTLAAALLVALAAYAAVMGRLGLPILPSSVLAKSEITDAAYQASPFRFVVRTVQNGILSLMQREGAVLTAGLALLALRPANADARTRRAILPLCGVAAAAVVAHVLFGRFGAFHRYEVYAMAIVVATAIVVWSDMLREGGDWIGLRTVGVALLLLVVALPYVRATVRTSDASENIYVQQYQMHRFATAYFPRSVAINDLGYVSFRNDAHVLDLVGLGSEKARQLMAPGGRTLEFAARLAADAGSVYAMIYDRWFSGDVPQGWCRVATLVTPPVVTASDSEVAFYLIDRTYEDEMEAALDAFGSSLPPVSRLVRHACDGAA